MKYWPKDRQTDQWDRVQKQTKTVTDFWQRYQGNLMEKKKNTLQQNSAGQLVIHMENISTLFFNLHLEICHLRKWKDRKRGLKMYLPRLYEFNSNQNTHRYFLIIEINGSNAGLIYQNLLNL